MSDDFDYDEFFFGDRGLGDPKASKSETDRRKRERIGKFEQRMRSDASERRRGEEAKREALRREEQQRQQRVEEARANLERQRLEAKLAAEAAERAKLEANDPFATFRMRKIKEKVEEEARGVDPGVPPQELFFGKRRDEEVPDNPVDQAKQARLKAFEARLQAKAKARRAEVERAQEERRAKAEAEARQAERRRAEAAKRRLEEKLAAEKAEQAKLEQGDDFAAFRKQRLANPDAPPPRPRRRRRR